MKKNSRSFISLVNLIIGVIISFLPGTYFLSKGLFDTFLALTSPSWPSIQSDVVYFIRDGNAVNATYNYTVDGVSYHNDRISFRYPFPEDEQFANQLRDGQMVIVYYWPPIPYQSTLQTGWGWGPVFSLGLGVLLLGLGLVAFKWGIDRIKVKNIDPVNWT